MTLMRIAAAADTMMTNLVDEKMTNHQGQFEKMQHFFVVVLVWAESGQLEQIEDPTLRLLSSYPLLF